jgi:ubiquinol-cytochrome c reductase cytochrome c1 subunit
MKTKAIAAILAGGVLAGALLAGGAERALASEGPALPKVEWSFNGPLGHFDRAQLKRGWQVFKQVCSACHSAHQLSYRNLVEIGFSEAEAKAIAAGDNVPAGPNEAGETHVDGALITRPALLSDKLAQPYPNPNAARAANNGALPPDLSLMTKARKGGADYVHALLTGYREPPAGYQVQPGMNYNEYFPGNQIAMPAPLNEGIVTYEDGTSATVEQMSRDVGTFLTWSAEPELEDRKRMGVKILAFVLVLTALLFALKRKIWADVH